MKSRIVAIAALLILTGLLASPAFAGGSWLYPDADSYQPGDIAVMAGDVSMGQLG
jgi:hypothetical protein